MYHYPCNDVLLNEKHQNVASTFSFFIRLAKLELNFEEHKSNIEEKRKIHIQSSRATKGK